MCLPCYDIVSWLQRKLSIVLTHHYCHSVHCYRSVHYCPVHHCHSVDFLWHSRFQSWSIDLETHLCPLLCQSHPPLIRRCRQVWKTYLSLKGLKTKKTNTQLSTCSIWARLINTASIIHHVCQIPVNECGSSVFTYPLWWRCRNMLQEFWCTSYVSDIALWQSSSQACLTASLEALMEHERNKQYVVRN